MLLQRAAEAVQGTPGGAHVARVSGHGGVRTVGGGDAPLAAGTSHSVPSVCELWVQTGVPLQPTDCVFDADTCSEV